MKEELEYFLENVTKADIWAGIGFGFIFFSVIYLGAFLQ